VVGVRAQRLGEQGDPARIAGEENNRTSAQQDVGAAGRRQPRQLGVDPPVVGQRLGVRDVVTL
jgi:hypothetical protein